MDDYKKPEYNESIPLEHLMNVLFAKKESLNYTDAYLLGRAMTISNGALNPAEVMDAIRRYRVK